MEISTTLDIVQQSGVIVQYDFIVISSHFRLRNDGGISSSVLQNTRRLQGEICGGGKYQSRKGQSGNRRGETLNVEGRMEEAGKGNDLLEGGCLRRFLQRLGGLL